jgi:hypothetical protein
MAPAPLSPALTSSPFVTSLGQRVCRFDDPSEEDPRPPQENLESVVRQWVPAPAVSVRGTGGVRYWERSVQIRTPRKDRCAYMYDFQPARGEAEAAGQPEDGDGRQWPEIGVRQVWPQGLTQGDRTPAGCLGYVNLIRAEQPEPSVYGTGGFGSPSRRASTPFRYVMPVTSFVPSSRTSRYSPRIQRWIWVTRSVRTTADR